MYSSIRRYRIDPAQIDDVLHRVDEELCALLEREPGFVAYQAIDCGDGNCLSITTFSSREGAEGSVVTSANWVGEALSDFDLERVDAFVGEAKVSRAIAEMLEPAHA